MTDPFDPLEYAKREMAPSLARLIAMTEDAAPEQHAFFLQLNSQLAGAKWPEDLLEMFVNLSTAAFLGFVYEPEVADTLDRVLAIAEGLSEALSVDDTERH